MSHSVSFNNIIRFNNIQSFHVKVAYQLVKRGNFCEILGDFRRGGGGGGLTIFTLNIVRSEQKCFLFVANSTLRLIQFNIIVLLALILTELEETFPKEYISDFLVCTKSCTQPYIMKMAIYPDHLAQGGALVWVPETTQE